MSYSVEIIKFTLTNIVIDVELADDRKTDLTVEYKMAFSAPKNPDDPTALLKIKATVNNEDSLLRFSCDGESVVRFDPIPEDIASAIKESCVKMVQEEMLSRIKQILAVMNPGLNFGQK